jgi:ribosomal protein L16 Arg81 hydroxylase
MKLAMLNGLTAQHFLSGYWRKKPPLIRSAFPGFKDFVSFESPHALARCAVGNPRGK